MTRRILASSFLATAMLGVGGVSWATVSRQTADPAALAEVAGTLGTYCYTCHNERVLAGSLVLEGRSPDDDIQENPAVWEKVQGAALDVGNGRGQTPLAMAGGRGLDSIAEFLKEASGGSQP